MLQIPIRYAWSAAQELSAVEDLPAVEELRIAMKPQLKIACLMLLAVALLAVALPDNAQAQFVTYYSPGVTTVYSPVIPTTVYSVPTTVYAAPTTVYSPVTTAYYAPPRATLYYDNGPLGLGFFPRRRVLYSPGYVAPVTTFYPTTGAVYGGW